MEFEATLAEVTRDCHTAWEQALALCGALQERIRFPFETQLLGRPAIVEGIALDGDARLVAQVTHQGRRRELPLLDVPLPTPPPPGAEWIAACRAFLRRRLRRAA